MAIEQEPEKSETIQEIPNPKEAVINDDDELEEGEIFGEEETSRVLTAQGPHPLEHQWTFWFDNTSGPPKQSTWGSSMRSIFTVSTVEEFWSISNNIHRPSRLAGGAALHFFKYKIEPKWEDPVCANGGRWTVTFPKGKSDTPWLYTLLAMIGEQFDHGDEICGAVVTVKPKQEKIALWTKNASNEAAQLSIGKQWKEFLDCNDSFGFVVHEDAKKFDRNAKNKYTI